MRRRALGTILELFFPIHHFLTGYFKLSDRGKDQGEDGPPLLKRIRQTGCPSSGFGTWLLGSISLL